MADGVAESARRVFGVALLALRASLRTKAVASLIALLTVCVVALPGVIKGDGTPAGELNILLSYTLGFSFGSLCLATLWAACALFAAEIDSARIQLSAVKPVRIAEFWVGKWLALLALNAALLAAVYAGVYAQVRWHLQRNGWPRSESLESRRVTRPLMPTPREEALQVFRQMKEQNALPKDVSEKQALRALEEKAAERYDVVNPGEPVQWKFRLERPVGRGDPVTVRVRFDTEFSTRELVKGDFLLAPTARPERAVEVRLDDFTQNEIEFVVDTRAFADQGPGDGVQGSGRETGELRDFVLTFRHAGDPKKSSALMLRSRQDVALLTPGGTFEANLLRAALIHGSVLALLAAFGLTLSACFSMPVAAFSATVLLVLTLVGNSVSETVSEEEEKSWLNRPGIVVSRAVNQISSRALRSEPLAALTRGERIRGEEIRSSVVWNEMLVPLIFAWAGCLVLRRREWAAGE